MNVFLSYTEISDYVLNHYGQKIMLEGLEIDTVKVTYIKKVVIVPVKFSLSVKIIEVEPKRVSLQYQGNFGIEKIISGLLRFLKRTMPLLAGAMTLSKENIISIDLSEIPQLESLLKQVAPQSLTASPAGITLTAQLL